MRPCAADGLRRVDAVHVYVTERPARGCRRRRTPLAGHVADHAGQRGASRDARSSGQHSLIATAYDPGAAVVVVATVDASISFPVHGFPFAGNGTNLPSFTWTNQPQLVGAALPNVAALMSIGWHERPAPS